LWARALFSFQTEAKHIKAPLARERLFDFLPTNACYDAARMQKDFDRWNKSKKKRTQSKLVP
jgi:hypothetical protein